MAIEIASTEFQARAGKYMDSAAKEPVYITRHGRPARVLIDAEEYEKLKAHHDRHRTHAVHVSELDEAFADELLAQPIPEEAEQFNDEHPAPAG